MGKIWKEIREEKLGGGGGDAEKMGEKKKGKKKKRDKKKINAVQVRTIDFPLERYVL